MTTKSAPPHTRCYIDAHVHIYPMFDVECLLTSAARHIGAPGGDASPVAGCLLLTETARYHAFDELRRCAEPGRSPGGWCIEETLEEETLVARREGTVPLMLGAGRQVQTAEGLEVLSLLSRSEIADGRSLDATVSTIVRVGGLPVLPWGFGKWWFGRRGALRRFLDSKAARDVHLGDNAGRPRGWPEPAPFRRARERGALVLPGSDPLPFAGEERRVGSYGLILEGPFDPARPAASLRRLLERTEGQPPTFGRRVGWRGFVRAQLAVRA